MPRNYKLSDSAEADLANIADWSLESFGEDAMRRYLELLDISFKELSEKPDNVFSETIRAVQLYLFAIAERGFQSMVWL